MKDTAVEVVEKKDEKPADFNSVATTSWNDMQRMAKAFSMSALIPSHLKGKFEDVLVLMQQGRELDIGPVQALNGINVIQGKPSVSPELQLALIRERAPEAFIKIEADDAKLEVRVTMAPSRARMDEGFTSTWDMKRAKLMGLDAKDNYKKQPLTMLKWRAVGEAARTVFPHITKGLYNSVEAEDFRGTRQAVDGSAADALNTKFGMKKEPAIEVTGRTFDEVESPEDMPGVGSGLEIDN